MLRGLRRSHCVGRLGAHRRSRDVEKRTASGVRAVLSIELGGGE